MSDTLLRVEDLKIYYPVAGSGFGKKEFVKAVDGVTFEVKKGEVFGIVGESGCGKSTLGRGVCKLENLTSGHVYLDGGRESESGGQSGLFNCAPPPRPTPSLQPSTPPSSSLTSLEPPL